MTLNLGPVPAGSTIYIPFTTYAGATGASVTCSGLAVTDVEIYKNGSVTQRSSDDGIALLDTDGIDFDGITGLHGFSIDLSDDTDASFYAVGSWYWVVVSAITVDSQTVTFVAAVFRIGPAESLTGHPKVDVGGWLGTAPATPTTNGVPEVDVTHWLGTAAATPTVAGVPEVDVTHWLGAATYERHIVTGTADSGTTNTLVDAARTEADTDYWKGQLIEFTSGNLIGQTRLITGFVPGTDTISFTPDVTQTVTTQNYRIKPFAGADVHQWIGTSVAVPTTAGVPEVDVTFINGSAASGAGTPNVNVVSISGDTTAADNAEAFFDGTGYAGTNNVIPVVTTVNGLAANTVTASALATDAVTEIQSGLATAANLATVAGYLDTEIAAILADTNELQTDWADGGRLDLILDAAGSAGDPWTTSLPGGYTGTQAGKILADVLVDTAEIGTAGAGLTNINLPNQTMDIVGDITGNLSGSVGSVTSAVTLPTIPVDWVTASGLAADAVTEIQSGLATAANLATLAGYVDTEVAAIKAKTDNLPTDPADQSAVEAAITAATSPLATAANLATVAGYLDTEIAAILADTNELQTDWANGGRLDLLLDQALAAALLSRQILGNKHTVQLNTPSAGLHTITVRNDDDTATVRTIVYNSATGARTVS